MVVWFDWRCKNSPTRAHHLVKVDNIDTGMIFRCLYCQRHKWYPARWSTIETYSDMIHKFGEDDAYNKLLDWHPAAKALMTKLEDLWYVRKEVKDDEAFVEVVKAVMKDRGYRKEEYND